MRKITAVLLCALMVILCFTSCMKSEAVKAVDEKIDAIGEITLDKEALIAEAESAYAQLPENEKNDAALKQIELARKNFEELKLFNDNTEALLDTYNKSFNEYGIPASAITEGYEALEEELAACDESLKGEYEKIFEEVKAEYDKYENMSADAVASAKAYVQCFIEMNKDKEIEIKEIGCIAQIAEGITYYLFALNYNDNEATDKKVYSTARFAGTPVAETMNKYADSFYSEAPASEKTDALINGNITIDVEAVLNTLSK